MSDQDDALLASLLSAVDLAPTDVPLRLHVAGLLLQHGDPVRALDHCAQALHLAPRDPQALALLAQVSAALGSEEAHPGPDGDVDTVHGSFDWEAAEQQLLGGNGPIEAEEVPGRDDAGPGDAGPGDAGPVGEPGPRLITLDDVGGMEVVKQEITESFLLPMANPELRAAYGASLRGGLLLYGPPGCGKTYLGRALAGELGASFTSFSLADLLDSMFGQSERNVRDIFDVARANRPSVLFFDEVDAIGQKRANLRSNPMMRGTVNQLLSEMDGSQSSNDGVFVLGASNQPWDVDPALRRPGRFDRTLFVPPPDTAARKAIFSLHLAGRPVADIDLDGLAKATGDFSGADIGRLCDVATRKAIAESARTGEIRPIQTSDLKSAMKQVRPTTREWFSTARNVVQFANQDGTYDDLAAYLKANKL